MGRAADHAKWEAGWPAAYEKTKSPYNYLAFVSVTGPSEAWYVIPLASQAYASAAARSAPSASWRTYEVVAGAPDGTYLVFSSVASFAEFDKVMTEGEANWKGMTFEERTALNKFSTEATLNTITNRFRLDPAESYVTPETRQKDPAFWMPKAPAKPPAPKKP